MNRIVPIKELIEPIDNLDQLARGTGARYLECTYSHIDGRLVAVQWRRKVPKHFQILIDYIGGK